MISLDTLRTLDIKDAHNWPRQAQLGLFGLVFLILIIAGYFLLWSDQLDSLRASRAQEEQYKVTYVEKKRQAINLEVYQAQMQVIQKSFGALLKQLPAKSEMEALLTEVNQAGTGRGLEFQLFKPASQEIKDAELAELPISIKVAGGYHDLAAFANDVAKLSRIVTLGNVQVVTNPPKSSFPLTMEATAHAYRVLEPEERAAMQKQLAQEKQKK